MAFKAGRLPLAVLEAPPFIVKLFNERNGSLGSDYYLIQREFAKKSKRSTATRSWLKVVVTVSRGHEVLVGSTPSGATVAIGSISSDHVYNEGIQRRLIGSGGSGGTGGGPPSPLTLEYRAVASALGEAREELRVRPSDVANIRVNPSCLLVPDSARADRQTIYIFVELALNPSVTLAALEARRRQDGELGEGPSFNEVGALMFIDRRDLLNPRVVGRRTRDLLGAI